MISSISALRSFEYDLVAGAPQRGQGGPAAGAEVPGQKAAGEPLSADEQAEVEKLKSRDREVRAHEQAHQAAGAGLITRGASYSYQRGPDGQQYAIGGEVGIDVSPVTGDPAATLRKAEQIRGAALAPASPSPQDRAVAAAAAQMAAAARQEQAQKAYSQTSAGGSATFSIRA